MMISALITVSLLSIVLARSATEKHERQRSPIALDTVIAEPSWSARDALRFDYGSRPSAIDCRDHHGHWEVRMNGEQIVVSGPSPFRSDGEATFPSLVYHLLPPQESLPSPWQVFGGITPRISCRWTEAFQDGHEDSYLTNSVPGETHSIDSKLHVSYLNETFVLQHFHAHWGDTVDQAGSEHVLNGRRATSEIHFVHRNIRYATMKEALGKPARLAVLAVLVDAVDGEIIDRRVDNQFWVLADLMRTNRNRLDRLRYLWRIDPMAMIPENSPFLHYTGSLTFNERGPVEWIVFEHPLSVRRERLSFLYEYGPANWNELHEIRDDTVVYRTKEDIMEDQSHPEGSGQLDDIQN